jgi:hypothetical protein
VSRLSSAIRPGTTPDRSGGWTERWVPSLASGALAAVVLLAGYLAHILLNDYRFPIGPDGPVYAWRASYAAEVGIAEVPGGRPGILAILLTLGGALSLEPVDAVTLLGPVAAVAVGLAGAALLEASLGPNLVRAMAGAILTGAFAAYLAGGWLSNIVLTATFLAALAALALAESSWRAVAGAAALLAAGALTHPLFATVVSLILAVVVAAMAGDALRRIRGGVAARDTAAFRVLAALGGGAAVAVVGLLPSLGATSVPGDTSQDGFLRRYGFTDLLRERYGERFAGDAGRAAVPLAAGVGLTFGAWTGARRSPERSRYLARVLIAWAAVTAIGVVLLAVTGWGPPNRLLVFAFFLPLGAAWGFGELAGRGKAPAAVAFVAAAAFAVGSFYGWYRQAPNIGHGDLVDVRRAGRAVAAIPDATPVVILVETDQPAAAFHVTRMANLLRMELPADRLPTTRIAVGSPADFRAGRPTRNGDLEHDRVARAYLREAAAVRREASLVVLERFNPQAYPEAVELGREVLPGIAVVGTPPEEPGDVAAGTARGLGGIGLVLLSAASVALLALLGGGWARWALPGATAMAVVGVAPAAGMAVIVVAGLAADVLGTAPGGTWALAAIGAAGAIGYLVARRP